MVYRASLNELLTLDSEVSFLWLRHIRSLLIDLGLKQYWENSTLLTVDSKCEIRTLFWNFTESLVNSSSSHGRLTNLFLDFKITPKFEVFLDEIEPLLAKGLYLKFRYGVLQTNDFVAKWANVKSSQRTSQ